jgi:hypothetical protein
VFRTRMPPRRKEKFAPRLRTFVTRPSPRSLRASPRSEQGGNSRSPTFLEEVRIWGAPLWRTEVGRSRRGSGRGKRLSRRVCGLEWACRRGRRLGARSGSGEGRLQVEASVHGVWCSELASKLTFARITMERTHNRCLDPAFHQSFGLFEGRILYRFEVANIE